jgi:hypothetical protein
MKLLNFLSLLDSEGRLSLTNVAMYVILVKLAIAPNPGLADIGALLLALANYAHKRYVVSQTPDEVVPSATPPLDTKQIDDLTSKVNAMALKLGFQVK